MFDSIKKLIIGDLEDKRAYRQMMKRVDALPPVCQALRLIKIMPICNGRNPAYGHYIFGFI